MAALNVKRHWWTRQMHPSAPEAPLFRVLAHRWQPVVRNERRCVPLHFAASRIHDESHLVRELIGREECRRARVELGADDVHQRSSVRGDVLDKIHDFGGCPVGALCSLLV